MLEHANITRNPDGSVTVKLDHPFDVTRGKTKENIPELTLKRLKARHMQAIDDIKGDTARTLGLLEGLTGIPKRELLDLDGADLNLLGEVVKEFTTKSPE